MCSQSLLSLDLVCCEEECADVRLLFAFTQIIKAQMAAASTAYSASAEEAITRAKQLELRRTFDDIDTDSSGFIDREELRVMLAALGKKVRATVPWMATSS